MNELCIGVDIEEIEPFRKLALNHRFCTKVFTETENRYCRSAHDAHVHYAARFAAKEAVMKAIKSKLGFKEIEVRNRENGSPYIILSNPKIAKRYRTEISLAHSKQMVIAFCIAYDMISSKFSACHEKVALIQAIAPFYPKVLVLETGNRVAP